MLVDDFKIPRTVPRPLLDMLDQIVEILNNDGYQRKVYTTDPTTSSAGIEGEKRIVVTGATLKEYLYASDQWWESDGTAAGGWSQLS